MDKHNSGLKANSKILLCGFLRNWIDSISIIMLMCIITMCSCVCCWQVGKLEHAPFFGNSISTSAVNFTPRLCSNSRGDVDVKTNNLHRAGSLYGPQFSSWLWGRSKGLILIMSRMLLWLPVSRPHLHKPAWQPGNPRQHEPTRRPPGRARQPGQTLTISAVTSSNVHF